VHRPSLRRKLYEELLIDADSEPKIHPLIFRAREQALSPRELWPQIDAIEEAISSQDVAKALAVLAHVVPEWQPGGGDVSTVLPALAELPPVTAED
jgi:hypothetical protein